jgi:hypothetical protein
MFRFLCRDKPTLALDTRHGGAETIFITFSCPDLKQTVSIMFVICISGRRNLAAPHLQQADWLHTLLRNSQSLLAPKDNEPVELVPVKNRIE